MLSRNLLFMSKRYLVTNHVKHYQINHKRKNLWELIKFLSLNWTIAREVSGSSNIFNQQLVYDGSSSSNTFNPHWQILYHFNQFGRSCYRKIVTILLISSPCATTKFLLLSTTEMIMSTLCWSCKAQHTIFISGILIYSVSTSLAKRTHIIAELCQVISGQLYKWKVSIH